MKSQSLIALTWGLVSHQTCQYTGYNSTDDKAITNNRITATLDQLVETFKDTCGAPGVSVCVSVGGTTVYSKGFGYADVEQGVKVTPQTKFRIASISKSFTSLLVGRMIDQNRIDLDKDVRSYLPSFSPKTKDGKKYPEEIIGTKSYESAQDSMVIFKEDPLVHSPGDDYLYSTYGFTVVSAVIEAIMAKAQPLESLFERPARLKPLPKEKEEKIISDGAKIDSLFHQLFVFLGLQNTCLDEPFKIVPFRARPYRRGKNNYGRLLNTAWVDNSSKWAGGGLLSTGPDLIRVANHLAEIYMGLKPLGNAPIVSRNTLVNYLWRPNTGTVQGQWIPGGLYGLGWFVARRSTIPADHYSEQVPADRLYVGHTGAAVGFTSVLLMSLPIVTEIESSTVSRELPPICVAVLVNLESASGIGILGVQIAEAVREALMSSSSFATGALTSYSKEAQAIVA